jgi:hypothetical protein
MAILQTAVLQQAGLIYYPTGVKTDLKQLAAQAQQVVLHIKASMGGLFMSM